MSRSVVALDSDGNIFVVGDTYSDDFPTLDPVQSEKRDRPGFYSSDVFIAKYSPGGGELLFATYLGGDREEYGWELAVGPTGLPDVAGTTKSADFPLVKPIQSDINQGPVVGSRDGFITRLSSDGSRISFLVLSWRLQRRQYRGNPGRSVGKHLPGRLHAIGRFPDVQRPQGRSRRRL